MGIESRDWYREAPRRTRGRGRLVAVGLALALVLLVLSPSVRDRLGIRLPFGLEQSLRSGYTPGALRIEPIAGGPGLTLVGPSLYPADDPWQPWLAGETACPRGEDRDAPAGTQVQVMLCLVDYARARQGLGPVALSPLLSAASARKAVDIQRCGRFEHEACGRPVDESARLLGYRGSFGENLYIAEAPLTSPRVTLDGWLNSPGHRENLFRPEWRTIGIALRSDVDVEQFDDAVIWVNEFGV